MNRFQALAAVTVNDDFAAILNRLAFLEPGDAVPEPETLSAELGIEKDAVAFFLDTLVEAAAIVAT